MNYSDIVNQLNNANGFDLYRLNVAIGKMLEDPKHMAQLKARVTPGQQVEYFDHQSNSLRQATLLKFKRKWVVVKNLDDGKIWELPYYVINLHNADADIYANNAKPGIDRNELKVGDIVGFRDYDNNEIYGTVQRLNQKTATLNCNGAKWLVGYQLLLKVYGPDQDYLPG